jgi:hypothetical protein
MEIIAAALAVFGWVANAMLVGQVNEFAEDRKGAGRALWRAARITAAVPWLLACLVLAACIAISLTFVGMLYAIISAARALRELVTWS